MRLLLDPLLLVPIASSLFLVFVLPWKANALQIAPRPYPPPRFDAFSEKLVRSWATIRASDGILQHCPVEEVMRSCGGAVQGIREVALIDGDDEGFYLNRANDGFLFLDDGRYTCGPIQWKEGEDSAPELFLSSFGISDTFRLLVTSE